VLVVDSSALVNALGGHGPLARRTREQLNGHQLVAPHHVDLETMSAWRRQVRSGQLTLANAEAAVQALKGLRIQRIPHAPLADRIWELRENVASADAAYVALAERLQAPLLTADARLTGAPGLRCEFQLIR
jgi:predicted nucleic acid-binding protein